MLFVSQWAQRKLPQTLTVLPSDYNWAESGWNLRWIKCWFLPKYWMNQIQSSLNKTPSTNKRKKENDCSNKWLAHKEHERYSRRKNCWSNSAAYTFSSSGVLYPCGADGGSFFPQHEVKDETFWSHCYIVLLFAFRRQARCALPRRSASTLHVGFHLRLYLVVHHEFKKLVIWV